MKEDHWVQDPQLATSVPLVARPTSATAGRTVTSKTRGPQPLARPGLPGRPVGVRRRGPHRAWPTRGSRSCSGGRRRRCRACRSSRPSTSRARRTSATTCGSSDDQRARATTSSAACCARTARGSGRWSATPPIRDDDGEHVGWLHRVTEYSQQRRLIDTLAAARAAARRGPAHRPDRQLGVGRRPATS